ncbi:MAG TPA: hypothetical protein VGM64_05465 [Lacunisphaera sp.]|jgi:hypothetical protein
MTAISNKAPKMAGIAMVFICLGFAAYTRHAWEDYLITFRASLNLATGHGLVYQPGERVHSFTSPLGTLLPALFALGGGSSVEIRALWCFRVASALALGAALWLTTREFLRNNLATWSSATACALWAFDPKIVDFSINGMESAFLIVFVVLTWRALLHGANLWPTALGFAGLQWTRPDGFVFSGALVAAWLFWAKPTGSAPSNRPLPTVARAVALSLALYLPWVLLSWWYYGSPIPHTIVAKQFHHPLAETTTNLALYPLRLIGGHVALHDIFMPAYFYFGGWPRPLAWFARLLGTGAALAWLCPGMKAPGQIASSALFIGGYYLEYIPGSPWYFPAWQILACIAWAYLLDAGVNLVAQTGEWRKIVRSLFHVTALSLIAVQLLLLGSVAWQMRNQQIFIEDNHRHEIGVWLHNHAAPNDRVYLEPLGYIGYYSGLKMLDNPGLSSPEVVAVRHAGLTTHSQIIQTLKPEWLVLRPDQVQMVNELSPRLLQQDYRLARIFDTRQEIDRIRFLPGRGYLNFDARFLVYNRRSEKTP